MEPSSFLSQASIDFEASLVSECPETDFLAALFRYYLVTIVGR